MMTAEMSAAQRVALLSPDDQEKILDGLDKEALLYDPHFWLRPSQLTPITAGSDFDLCVILAGRGYGKTRVLSEWARNKAMSQPGSRGAIVARTAADVRDVVVHGQSGILAVSPPDDKPLHEPSKRLLTWPNGTEALLFSSEAPDSLRGPQFDWAVADEIASWYYLPDESGLTAWDNLRLATRLGVCPQIVAATTPRKTPFMRALMKLADDLRTIMIRGRTKDNEMNLAATYLNVIYGLYAGTRLARQELDGELLDDNENALWSEDLLNSTRLTEIPDHPLRVVAVDPSVAARPKDECGICVVGATNERDLVSRHVYVLDDRSIWGPPAVWAQRVVDTCEMWGVRTVVAEGNQGGALVAEAIHAINANLRVEIVHASVNKQTRAEPVALLWDRGRAHMIGVAPELEMQLVSWDPSDPREKSPDRLDAMVWGVTALAIKPVSGLLGGELRTSVRATQTTLPMAARMPMLAGLGSVAALSTGNARVDSYAGRVMRRMAANGTARRARDRRVIITPYR
jgi:phage terminase large subunit-like protein